MGFRTADWEREYLEWKQKWYIPQIAQRPDPIMWLEQGDKGDTGIFAKPKSELSERELKEREGIEMRAQARKDAMETQKRQKIGPRDSKADFFNDTKSVLRCMDRKLYFIVKGQDGEDTWDFPRGFHKEGETLRQCAERVLKERLGDKMQNYFATMAPNLHYSQKYSPEVQKERQAYGKKTFYYVPYYLQGDVDLNTDLADDYLWNHKAELKDIFEKQEEQRRWVMLDYVVEDPHEKFDYKFPVWDNPPPKDCLYPYGEDEEGVEKKWLKYQEGTAWHKRRELLIKERTAKGRVW